jgi:hypothetical protein
VVATWKSSKLATPDLVREDRGSGSDRRVFVITPDRGRDSGLAGAPGVPVFPAPPEQAAMAKIDGIRNARLKNFL